MNVERWGWYSVGLNVLLAALHAAIAAASGSLAVAAELVKAQATIRRIEALVRAAVPHVERVLLHPEPAAPPHVRCAVPLADAAGTLSAHFGEAPYFALVTLRRADGGIAEQRVVANPHRALETAKGIRVAEWLVAQKIDTVVLHQDVRGKGPEYVFREAGVELRHTDKATLAEAIALQKW